MLKGGRDHTCRLSAYVHQMNPQGGNGMTTDYLNELHGKTVATANLEPEEGSKHRWVAVLTFTDGSRVTFMADIDRGVEYVATLAFAGVPDTVTVFP